MIISSDEFYSIVYNKLLFGEDFYVSLLEKIIDYPSRYFGLFRLSSIKEKLIQNITQSREIKFGDIIEELCTRYIEKLGYTNLNKNLGKNESGDELRLDQYFTDGQTFYVCEMKIRDDHDSSKKRGQYDNFIKKVTLVRQKNPLNKIDASIWFVDPTLTKNKNYYLAQIKNEDLENAVLHLYYGSEFFTSLKNGLEAWNDLISLLEQYHREKDDVNIEIPDFATSEEMFNALLKISDKHWKKLNSNDEEIIRLRNELFSNGDNLAKAKKKRPL